MTNAEVVIQGLAGGVISGALGLLIWHIKQQRSDFSEFQKINDVYLRKIRGDIEQIEKDDIRRDTKIDALSEQLKEIKADISQAGKLEGRIDEHMNLMSNYIATMGHMSRQIDALFRFVDDKKRQDT